MTTGDLISISIARKACRDGTLKAWLRDQGISQGDLARHLDTHRVSVSRWVNGTRAPRRAAAIKIGRLLTGDISTEPVDLPRRVPAKPTPRVPRRPSREELAQERAEAAERAARASAMRIEDATRKTAIHAAMHGPADLSIADLARLRNWLGQHGAILLTAGHDA